MQKEISIKEVNNGYHYTIKGNERNNGEYIARNTDEFKLLEHIGEVILGYKIKVERR